MPNKFIGENLLYDIMEERHVMLIRIITACPYTQQAFVGKLADLLLVTYYPPSPVRR